MLDFQQDASGSRMGSHPHLSQSGQCQAAGGAQAATQPFVAGAVTGVRRQTGLDEMEAIAVLWGGWRFTGEGNRMKKPRSQMGMLGVGPELHLPLRTGPN